MNNNLQNRVYSILNKTRDTNTSNNTAATTSAADEEKENIYGITDPQTYMNNLRSNIEENATIKSLNTNIFGIPHQFLPTSDIRCDEKNRFGLGFFNNIYLEKPLVTLMPGKMLFLPSYSKSNKKLFASLAADDGANAQAALNELKSEGAGTRYYDFTSDYTAFMSYVNLMCRVAAVYLGLDQNDPD